MVTEITTPDQELQTIKNQMAELRARRRELMHRLSEAKFSWQKIADIYGCERQYVGQEIAAYNKTKKTRKVTS